MPHLTLECSANLRNFGHLSKLCQTLARILVAQRGDDDRPVYPIGGVRVRALVAEDYCVGDGRAGDAAFVHACLKIGTGRSEAIKRATGDALFEAIKQHFTREFQTQGLALSLEIAEFSEAGTWKHNNLHQRFAAVAARDGDASAKA
ncbi:MAG: 5-carboxymethyl-2-hydroxymuconate Delta-isomerase [Lautropia sp.]